MKAIPAEAIYPEKITLKAAGKPAGGEYIWTITAPGLTVEGAGDTVILDKPGQYTASVIYKWRAATSKPATATALLRPTVTLTAAPAQTVDEPNTITLLATGTPPNGDYKWSIQGPSAPNPGNSNVAILVAPGVYGATVTYKLNGAESFPASISAEIKKKDDDNDNGDVDVTVKITPSKNPATVGDMVELVAVGNPDGGNYMWDDGSTGSSVNITSNTPTIITRSVTYTYREKSATDSVSVVFKEKDVKPTVEGEAHFKNYNSIAVDVLDSRNFIVNVRAVSNDEDSSPTVNNGILRLKRVSGNENIALFYVEQSGPSTQYTLGDPIKVELYMAAADIHVTVFSRGPTGERGDGPTEDLVIEAEFTPEKGHATIKDQLTIHFIKFELVTKGSNNELLPHDFTYNSVPPPQIDVTVHRASVSEDGRYLSMSLSGVVTDQASDLVDVPDKQLQALDIKLGGQIIQTIALQNSDTPQLPWRPYAFKANFATSISNFAINGAGKYSISLETSENVAGCKGCRTITAFVIGEEQVVTAAVVASRETPKPPIPNNLLKFTVSVFVEANNEGTFLPSMIRVKCSSNYSGYVSTITTFGRDWAVKRMNWGDGECLYIVDDQNKAVVFLPAAYAHTHIQCIPLEDMFTVIINAGKGNPCSKKFQVARGLLVKGDSDFAFGNTDGLVASAIKSGYVIGKGTIGKDAYRWYQPDPELDPAIKAIPVDDTIRTEIIWRYVCTPKTIVMFNDNDELRNDIAYRLKVIASAETLKVPWGSGDNFKLNPKFWIKDPYSRYIYIGNSTRPALDDLWNTPNEYALACYDAAFLITCRAAVTIDTDLTLMIDRLATQVRNELYYAKDAFQKEYQLDNYWIPGDWGYIDNPNNSEQTLYGRENVIYIGAGAGKGCFDLDTIKFLDTGRFWGFMPTGGRTQSLNAWKITVGAFPGTPNPGPQSAVIKNARIWLKQPVTFVP